MNDFNRSHHITLQTPCIKSSESWQTIILTLTTSIPDTEMLSRASGFCYRNSSYKMEKAGKITFSQRRLFLEWLGVLSYLLFVEKSAVFPHHIKTGSMIVLPQPAVVTTI